ncbi:uroporphyrinogen-III synthase [Candidatus Enterovibrio escicola]|uniref:Uroporphyrinogen-III synthase n=1 Tax=Candidatus Enterovibrio escicola TaxID=1927127 RepID=A0A2A5SZ38_9GAMM|nr:uroporphyrinogen-III synthase [Candidatus Enterovibrio escacola]PCS21172.1 Uroporphyrinogen-III synthase [Candidatus Enterovibrio escacola]
MTILVVRPAPSCFKLVNSLNQAGMKALSAPLLSFSAGNDLPTLSNCLDALPSQSVVVAISPRSVEYACVYMHNHGNFWRKDLHYVAVGKKTARTWCKQGGVDVLQPPTEDSKGILAMSLFANLKPDYSGINRLYSNTRVLSVLILRGNGGNALLGETLRDNNVIVHYFEAYQRHWHSADLPSLMVQWRYENVDTLVITSGEQLSLLWKTISNTNQQWLKECHILVPSKRIYNQAINFGFSKINCVNSAANSTLFHVLYEMTNSGHSDDRQ